MNLNVWYLQNITKIIANQICLFIPISDFLLSIIYLIYSKTHL